MTLVFQLCIKQIFAKALGTWKHKSKQRWKYISKSNCLYIGLSAEDNVVSAASEARRMLLYLKRPFATLTPNIALPLYKAFIRPHLEYAIQASSPILSRDYQAQESVQKLALKFVKGLRHVPYETALQRLRLFSLVLRRICGDLICMYKIMHDLLDFPCDTIFVGPTRIGIHQQPCKTRRRQHAFSVRVVPNWWAAPLYQEQWNLPEVNNWHDCLA